MSQSIESTVYSWLKSLQIHVDKSYLGNRITSHPDYPSALCVTSLLDELGIQNATVEIDKGQLKDITFPILFFAEGNFHLLKNPSLETNYPRLSNLSNVVILVAEKPDKLNEPEQLLNVMKEKEIERMKWRVLIAAFGSLILVASLTKNISDLLLMGLSITGTLITASMILTELGISNQTIEKLCGKGADSTCSTVLNSKGATIALHVKWSDVGLGYFLGMMVLLLLKSFGTVEFNSASGTIMAWFAIAGIPFITYSIYYQWRVVKQWCRLCLIALGLLMTINVTYFIWPAYAINSGWVSIVYAIIVFSIPGFVWLLIRSILENERKLYNTNIQLQRITRSAEIFQVYIQNQRKVDVTPWPHDIHLGNASANIQILAVCNPYCLPCARAHELLDKLLSNTSDMVGITFRFTCSEDINDEGTKVVSHFLKYAFEDYRYKTDKDALRYLLNSWFHDFDSKQLEQLYPVSETMDVSYYTGMHWRWCEESDIEHTPTIFVNGYELVMPYTIADLSSLIRSSNGFCRNIERMSQTII